MLATFSKFILDSTTRLQDEARDNTSTAQVPEISNF